MTKKRFAGNHPSTECYKWLFRKDSDEGNSTLDATKYRLKFQEDKNCTASSKTTILAIFDRKNCIATWSSVLRVADKGSPTNTETWLQLFSIYELLEHTASSTMRPLTKTRQGHLFVFVFTSRYSQFSWAVPGPNVAAPQVATVVLRCWAFLTES